MFFTKPSYLSITNNEITQNSKSKPKKFLILCTFKWLTPDRLKTIKIKFSNPQESGHSESPCWICLVNLLITNAGARKLGINYSTVTFDLLGQEHGDLNHLSWSAGARILCIILLTFEAESSESSHLIRWSQNTVNNLSIDMPASEYPESTCLICWIPNTWNQPYGRIALFDQL